MLHLSLLTLPRRVSRWRLLNAYGLHQVLWKAFPDLKRGEDQKRFLYRYDEVKNEHGDEYLSVLVQSITEPDWAFLDNESEGTTVQVRTFDPLKLEEGAMLRFFVRTNPVASRNDYDDHRARRIVVGARRDYIATKLNVNQEELPSRESMLLGWLERKGEVRQIEGSNLSLGGFQLARDHADQVLCTISPNRDYLLRRSDADRKSKPITLTTVDFSGILRVTDPTAFANTLRRGIGRGKAFGCGMVSVRRV